MKAIAQCMIDADAWLSPQVVIQTAEELGYEKECITPRVANIVIEMVDEGVAYNHYEDDPDWIRK